VETAGPDSANAAVPIHPKQPASKPRRAILLTGRQQALIQPLLLTSKHPRPILRHSLRAAGRQAGREAVAACL
jgi:hypothetical protein